MVGAAGHIEAEFGFGVSVYIAVKTFGVDVVHRRDIKGFFFDWMQVCHGLFHLEEHGRRKECAGAVAGSHGARYHRDYAPATGAGYSGDCGWAIWVDSVVA